MVSNVNASNDAYLKAYIQYMNEAQNKQPQAAAQVQAQDSVSFQGGEKKGASGFTKLLLLGAAGVGAYFFSKGKLGKKWLGKLQKLLGIKPKVVLKEAKISAGTVRGNDLKYSADEIAANMDRVSSEYANSHAAKQKIYESVFKPIETPKLNFPA